MITQESFIQLWEEQIADLKESVADKAKRIKIFQRFLKMTNPTHTGLGMAWLYDRLITAIAAEKASQP